jgi:hypothetical protein
MARLRVPKSSDIDEASRQSVEHRTKLAGSQTGDAETVTPEREALEHPHILFRLQRDPLLVAMSAPGLDEPEPRTPAAARKDAGSRARRGRGK